MQSIVSASYAVYFNETAYAALRDHLEENDYSSVFVLVDENTREHCLPRFLDMEMVSGPGIIAIPAGEAHKHIQTCNQVWQALSDGGADRKSILINLGGGVVTDLGGFVASTFKRGIAFINIPTTLLAMVDASVGGKTGVDLGPLKNQIGVINQPEMVLIDPGYLQTLDQRQLRSGFAEVLKHGLIQDRKYWNTCKDRDTYRGIDALIHESVVIKNRVVLEDPTEKGLRKILNFGHTLGHALESYSLENDGFKSLLHGEAIAAGMIMEAFLSHSCAALGTEDLKDITVHFLDRYGKVEIGSKAQGKIVDLMRFDKKNTHGQVNFVLLDTIGKPRIDVRVPPQALRDAFAYYKEA